MPSLVYTRYAGLLKLFNIAMGVFDKLQQEWRHNE